MSGVGVAAGALGGHEIQKNLFAEEQALPAIARRRAQWKKYQGRLDPRALDLHRRDLGQDEHDANPVRVVARQKTRCARRSVDGTRSPF